MQQSGGLLHFLVIGKRTGDDPLGVAVAQDDVVVDGPLDLLAVGLDVGLRVVVQVLLDGRYLPLDFVETVGLGRFAELPERESDS